MNAIRVDEMRMVPGGGQGQDGCNGSRAVRRERDPSSTAVSLLLQGNSLHVGQLMPKRHRVTAQR